MSTIRVIYNDKLLHYLFIKFFYGIMCYPFISKWLNLHIEIDWEGIFYYWKLKEL